MEIIEKDGKRYKVIEIVETVSEDVEEDEQE